jgi:poly(A) polymerase Pap1
VDTRAWPQRVMGEPIRLSGFQTRSWDPLSGPSDKPRNNPV